MEDKHREPYTISLTPPGISCAPMSGLQWYLSKCSQIRTDHGTLELFE